ncbi:MAG TPA: ATP-dependent DNA ligase, partial [Lysobacter sp.]|nr:ATP-dependent DNA ligase [Lysobacter sp.]
DKADRIVFDLDPGPDVPFAEVKRAARQLRDMLAQVKLVSFLRTSGGKGLHVVVPLNPANDWALVKRFAHAVADTLAKNQPKRFVAVSTLKLRPGKIFVDYLRNDRGATSVASYSLRARPGAPVALPLAWSELSRLQQPDAFNLVNVPAKLKRRKKDPWEGIERINQNLARWKE